MTVGCSRWWTAGCCAGSGSCRSCPPLAATAGWLFTETARQPWLVFGLFRTADGVSPGLTPVEIVASLAGFAAVYGLLAVVWVRLVLRVARTADDDPVPEAADTPDRPLVPSY